MSDLTRPIRRSRRPRASVLALITTGLLLTGCTNDSPSAENDPSSTNSHTTTTSSEPTPTAIATPPLSIEQGTNGKIGKDPTKQPTDVEVVQPSIPETTSTSNSSTPTGGGTGTTSNGSTGGKSTGGTDKGGKSPGAGSGAGSGSSGGTGASTGGSSTVTGSNASCSVSATYSEGTTASMSCGFAAKTCINGSCTSYSYTCSVPDSGGTGKCSVHNGGPCQVTGDVICSKGSGRMAASRIKRSERGTAGTHSRVASAP